MGKIMKMQKGLEANEQAMEQAIESSKAHQEEEEFLNHLRRGKTRKEAYEAIGREKTWASKILKKIRETEPERLKGTLEEIKDEAPAEQPEQNTATIKATATEAPKQEPVTPDITAQEAKIATEPPQAIQSTPAEEKAANKANTKQKKQVFSFRATLDNIEIWKAYSTATGQTMEAIGTAALNEYLDRHELTGTEQVIFEALKIKNRK